MPKSAPFSAPVPGIALLELAGRAVELFAKQPAGEKRLLLDFVLSNCTWANGELTPAFRQPFDMIALEATACAKEKVAGTSFGDLCQARLPEGDCPRNNAMPSRFRQLVVA